MLDKDTTPPDHTDLSELREKLIEIVDGYRFDQNWQVSKAKDFPDHKGAGCGCAVCQKIAGLNAQAADEILALFKQYAQPPVVADKELDEILLRLYLGDSKEMASQKHQVEINPALKKAKAALLQREQRLVAEALDDYMQDLKNVARDYTQKYPDADINDFIGLIVGTRNQPQRLAQLRHNTNTGKEEAE